MHHWGRSNGLFVLICALAEDRREYKFNTVVIDEEEQQR